MAKIDIFKQFITFNENFSLFRRSDSILLGVSGGVDSIVLMDLFLLLRLELNLKIAVAHVNHGLRGKKSDQDETHVRNLARDNGVQFYSCKMNVQSYAERQHQSLEEAGRDIRFYFFSRLMNRLQYTCLALGHQANDQAETVLDFIMRGSGIRGLAGIPLNRDKYIRPLRFASRNEIESFAAQNHQSFCTDKSNKDIIFRPF